VLHLSADDLRKVLFFDVREAGAWQLGQKLLSTTRQHCSKGIAMLNASREPTLEPGFSEEKHP